MADCWLTGCLNGGMDAWNSWLLWYSIAAAATFQGYGVRTYI